MSDDEAREVLRKQMPNLSTEAIERELEAKKRMFDERRKHMSPPGTLGLPKLLEERRQTYLIPDEAFRVTACFDRVFLWQTSMESSTYGGGVIHKTDSAMKADLENAPQGVIVGAGMSALDALVSNGMGLGHLVWFTRVTPLRIEIGAIAGLQQKVLVLHCSDLVGSLDTADMLKKRELRVRYDQEHAQHQYIDAEGNALTPVLPEDSEAA